MRAADLMPAVLALALASCDDSAVMTNYIAVSPDKQHTIAVETKDYGGPGTAAIITGVNLQSTDGKRLGSFAIEHQQLSTAGVIVVCSSPSKAELYEYGGKLDGFTPELAGIHIQIHDISRNSEGNAAS